MAHSLQPFNGYNFILASASPRRAQLLKLIGLDFSIISNTIDEDKVSAENPVDHVKYLALEKAKEVSRKVKHGVIIGADTIVVLDKRILGKPRDDAEAKDMLTQLSGRNHTVYTGFALMEKPSGQWLVDYERTSVHFRTLSQAEIDAYIATGGPRDKAGAYGIQDLSAIFVDRVEGCFYNVVGFPLAKFFETFKKFAEMLDRS